MKALETKFVVLVLGWIEFEIFGRMFGAKMHSLRQRISQVPISSWQPCLEGVVISGGLRLPAAEALAQLHAAAAAHFDPARISHRAQEQAGKARFERLTSEGCAVETETASKAASNADPCMSGAFGISFLLL